MAVQTDIHPSLTMLLEAVLQECHGESWSRSDAVVSAAWPAIFRAKLYYNEIRPLDQMALLVAAVIDNCEIPAVDNRVQATLYVLSAVDEHRSNGWAWLEAHPKKDNAPRCTGA